MSNGTVPNRKNGMSTSQESKIRKRLEFVAKVVGTPRYSAHIRPVGGKSTLAHFLIFWPAMAAQLFVQRGCYDRGPFSRQVTLCSKWKLEKLYESGGTKPKLCSYRPVGGKSTLVHLFDFLTGHGRPWQLICSCRGVVMIEAIFKTSYAVHNMET